MANIGRELRELQHRFKAKLDRFFSDYNEKIGIKVGSDIFFESDGQDYVFKIEISGLPRSRSGKDRRKKVTVYIEGFLSGQNLGRICGYGTRVSYVEVRSNEYEYLEGFHFDYRKALGVKIQGGHPLFHLQLDKTAASDFVRYRLSGKCSGEEICTNYFLKQIRIPSVQMDAFSCILMVIADHLFCDDVKAEFHNLVNEVHSMIPSMDMSEHDQSTQSLFSLGKISSSAWYFASF